MTAIGFQKGSAPFGGSAPAERQFIQVTKENGYLPVVRRIFEEILTPLYGSQEKALNQIGRGEDRLCYLLYENKEPLGVIVFKRVLSDEFAEVGIEKSVEIKSLFLVNSASNSGKGLGSALLNKIAEEVFRLNLGHKSFHVTVSETKRESLIFFLNRGFSINQLWLGKYQKGTREYLLSCSAEKIHSLVQKSPPFQVGQNEEEEKKGAIPWKDLPPQVLGFIPNAHWGRVHALKLLSDKTFVSGSEDNTLRKWSGEGKLVRAIRDVEPWGIDSANWVTAMTVLNQEYWVSGERNSRICLWNTAGDYIRDLTPKLPRLQHFSKENNRRRVNCLTAGVNPFKPTLFVGFPTLFDEYNVIESRTVSSTKVSDNDWVYCVHPIDENHLLAVTAGKLEAWSKQGVEWKRGKTLLHEPKRSFKTRFHITSLTPLESSPNTFAVGLFGGAVKVVDATEGKLIWEQREHQDHVWSVENVTPEVFATGSEDHTLKLWDARLGKSVCTIKDSIGPISSLLRLTPQRLVAGSSSKDPIGENKGGARLTFYDLRK